MCLAPSSPELADVVLAGVAALYVFAAQRSHARAPTEGWSRQAGDFALWFAQ